MPTQLANAVLVHSPFLGPASLRPLADALAHRGLASLLVDLRVTVSDPPVHQRLIGSFADAMDEAGAAGPAVLVGHSGAGPLLPAFAEELDEAVVGLVYLDAGLPTPGRSFRDLAPELFAHLRGRSREGRLPRWQQWFDVDPLAELIADAELRAEIAEESPEVALAFLKEQRPSVDWSGPSGYLQLSTSYTKYRDEMAASGRPVRRLDAHHLAAATDPELVAEALVEVLTEVTAG
ncbi:hypothetical protein GCM10010174_62770 [Kutzneria viridogrisea]|uniref:Uncharacterized protein n=2 Tax=Kutzneria TaxID=43356 RepID=W5WIH9_9PSEU|nr:alpha/beta fold hydrolase [Kutzneria albida]AHI00633.1 hypothetical protein KALB_7275 [Kutzneria albida DSM 43870]MBA8925812.1 pimeloyl-ACP methyl ester carboxylesterase [Kutzneria viridogrisea]